MLLCAVVRLTAAAGVKETMGEPGFLMCSLSIPREGGLKGGGLGNVKRVCMEFFSQNIARHKKKTIKMTASNDVHGLL